jgi:hypothetical protein
MPSQFDSKYVDELTAATLFFAACTDPAMALSLPRVWDTCWGMLWNALPWNQYEMSSPVSEWTFAELVPKSFPLEFKQNLGKGQVHASRN